MTIIHWSSESWGHHVV